MARGDLPFGGSQLIAILFGLPPDREFLTADIIHSEPVACVD